jgi:hypothetical protein
MDGNAQSSGNGRANLVCLVVVLWVIFEHFRLFSVLEIPDQIVDSEVLPPLFVGNKPIVPWVSATSINTIRVSTRM